MSYLDRPRINFSGTFQASPATINNTPNNYNPANYNKDTLKAENIELYWEPKGDSIFNLVNCQVTTAEITSYASDPLVGGQVAALYTSSPPKLVDLDPMQQNGSEIWGLTMMIGDFAGPNVQGLFTPIAFNGIWGNSQGENTPRNSASGSAMYISTLTNLKWNAGNSPVLQRLQAASPKRLSIRMVVSAHNNAPQMYAFNQVTFSKMSSQGVPSSVVTKLQPLTAYYMNSNNKGVPIDPGYIPTIEYVNYLLAQLLQPGELTQYGATILAATQQEYKPWINYETKQPLPEQPLFGFNYGKIVGSIGPCHDDEPSFVVPARSLAPDPAPQRQLTPPPPPPDPPPPPPPPAPPSASGWWAGCKLDLDVSPPTLTLDLANSLPVRLPGRPLWQELLGTLSLASYTQSGGTPQYTTIVPSLDYANPEFIDQRAGLMVITDFGGVDPRTLAGLPLAVLTTPPASPTKPFLTECPTGWSLRSDQFVYRMNPGMPTTPDFGQGEDHTVDFHVRKFGKLEGTEGVQLGLSVLTPSQASAYTLSTLGTSGTKGIDERNLSLPPGRLTFPTSTLTVRNGKASVKITGLDPGNPRQYVDGQVYFMTYNFTPEIAGFAQEPDDVVSTQIYQQQPIVGLPTWNNGIGNLLRQYGMLYPIMGQFQLWTYQGVWENRVKIQRVLGLDISQPLHMPVTRDLSAIRLSLIMDWFRTGLPYDQVGPAGTTSQAWNNLPEVGEWGPLTGVIVGAGDIVDSITAIYGTQTATLQGGPGGSPNRFDLGDDAITGMTGVTGTYFGATHICQLTFTTARGRTYGPFGNLRNVSNQRPFSLGAPTGCRINSFFGGNYTHTDRKTFVSAIGGNVMPV